VLKAPIDRLSLLAIGVCALMACRAVPEKPERFSHSMYGCMSAVVRAKVPPHTPDKHAHCLAAGFIARYCSVNEAYLASALKEGRDLFGRGNADAADWHASRSGIGCARRATNDAQIESCCRSFR
jgi:hypothetical protein